MNEWESDDEWERVNDVIDEMNNHREWTNELNEWSEWVMNWMNEGTLIGWGVWGEGFTSYENLISHTTIYCRWKVVWYYFILIDRFLHYKLFFLIWHTTIHYTNRKV